jgi:mannose-6-phosphate isomerase-like protein (cupin superfamily)
MLPGLQHRTLAGAEDGMKRVAVWEEVIAPGAATTLHRHACEEVIIVLEGSGLLEIAGDYIAFTSQSTIIVPHDTPHRLVNTGDGDLKVIAALSTAYPVVTTPDGRQLASPWS